MKKFIIYHFNLIEIALAMCVIAIGISGVMSLFALGAKANRQSIANNNLSEIAEYMIGTIHSTIKAQAKVDNLAPTGSLLFRIKNSSTSVENEPVKNLMQPGDDWENSIVGDSNILDSDSDNDKNIKREINKNNAYVLTHKTYGNLFLFRQISNTSPEKEPNVDFSCIAKVTLEPIPAPTKINNMTIDDEVKNLSIQYAIGVCIELSYPADFPYENREKCTYKLEIFNPKFEIQNFQN